MSDRRGGVTRRDFLRGVGYAALAGAAGLGSGRPAQAQAKSRVVLIRDEHAIEANGAVNAQVVQQMLDQAVAKLLGTDKAAEAWKQVVKATDQVGIKSNVWAPLPTPKEVEAAIKQSVIAAGVPEGQVRIDDRGARTTLANCTALINVRPLRTHHWAGVGGCLKNPITFVPKPQDYHGDSCADLGAFWKLPIIKDKIRLNILVVLTPQFHNRGPHHFDPRYVWPYKGLLVSQDPVAVDAVGVKLLAAKRRSYFDEDRPFPTRTKHIQVAAEKHGLGVSDLEQIELVKLGWEEDLLI
jgi:hypothetical protein